MSAKTNKKLSRRTGPDRLQIASSDFLHRLPSMIYAAA
jgi:hypothetical protein